MRFGVNVIKATAGLLVLFALAMMVSNWVGDYRAASGGAKEPSSRESTGTTEATAAPEPAEGEDAEPAESAAPTGKTVIVLVDGLNFRSAPSRDSELIRGLDADEKLVLLGEEDGWLKVRDSGGETGYVSSSGSYTRVE